MNDVDLREMLQSKAADFDLPSAMPASVRRRSTRRLVAKGATSVLVLVGVVALVLSAASRDSSPRVYVALAASTTSRHDASDPRHTVPATHHDINQSQLEAHRQCMHDHGIELPPPTETGAGAWSIIVDSPPLGDENMRIASMVDCRLDDVTDQLVLGGRTADDVARLRACTQSRGYVLPEPVHRGNDDIFDLRLTTPAWGTADWYRTVFVECALVHP